MLQELRKRNPHWFHPQDSPRHDVELRVPLTELLNVEDQKARVREIIGGAIPRFLWLCPGLSAPQ